MASFSDTSNKQGLIQDCETLLGMEDGAISGDTTLLSTFTRMINFWYRKVDSWIWEAGGGWQFDDSNYTKLPRATTDLVDGQRDYELPSIARQIIEVHIKDSEGNWIELKPIDKGQYSVPLDEYFETNGVPEYYDIEGRSIFLYPAPDSDDVTTTSGLRILIGRDISEFTSTDTTKEPGFDNHFHRILSLGASLDYCIGYLPDDISRINNIRAELNGLREELREHYSSRHRDFKSRIQPKRRKYK